MPSGGGGRAVSLGDADGDGDLDIYALISNLTNNTNPNDVVLLNNALAFAPVAGAAGLGRRGRGRRARRQRGRTHRVPRAERRRDGRPCSTDRAAFSVGITEGESDEHRSTEARSFPGPVPSASSWRSWCHSRVGSLPRKSREPEPATGRPWHTDEAAADSMRRPRPARTSSSTTSTTCATRSPAPSTRCSSCRRRGSGWRRAPVHADVRRRPLVLPVPVLADDRPLPAQQRRPGQQDGPNFDAPHSMACYLRSAGYATYIDGKFLTTWPKTDAAAVLRPLDRDVGRIQQRRGQGRRRLQTATGYSTTYLGNRGRQYITSALSGTKPFLLYETPQAPHWVDVTNPNGTTSKLAVPETKYASATVGHLLRRPRGRPQRQARLRAHHELHHGQGQAMCQSQLRAIMSADDEFGATMQLLSDRGVLANTLVIFSSDNGYMWGEHGRWEKFVPYEPSIRVPLWVRWPGHFPAGTDTTRHRRPTSTCCPPCSRPPGITLPARAALDGESLCRRRPHDDVRRVLRRHRQPQHPLLADGAHPDGQVHPDVQHHRRASSPASTTTSRRPGGEHQPPRRRHTANDPPAARSRR